MKNRLLVLLALFIILFNIIVKPEQVQFQLQFRTFTIIDSLCFTQLKSYYKQITHNKQIIIVINIIQ